VSKVPTAAEAARRRRELGEYGVSRDMSPGPAEGQPRITLTCPVCSTLIHATADQVGQELACPDCDTLVAVTPPAEIEQKRRPSAAPVEGYALWDEVEGAAVGRRPAEQAYVPATCPVCKTFMQVLADQVGRQIVCPDCGEPMVVPPPVKAGRKAGRRAPELGEYALHEEEEGPLAGARGEESAVFPLHCPQCNTLIYAGRDQVGQQMVCGDCEAWFVVPPPPPPKRKLDLRSQAGEVYDVGESVEVPQYEPVVLTAGARIRPGAGSAADRDKEATRARPGPPPRWTFFSGVFGFPAYRNSWSRWVGLSLGLIVPLSIGRVALNLAMAPAGPWAAAAPWIAAAWLCGVTFVFGSIWAVVGFAYCLSIVRDTADGYNEVENWPEALFLDWIGEFFFLTCSLSVSVLAGLAAGRVLAWCGVAGWPAVFGCVVLMFPLILLAMLETNSPLNPFSLPVWRSLFTAWWAWGLFYVETTLLVAAAGGLAWLAAIYVPVVGIALAAPVLVAALMIYFRLLGRLAWRCGGGRPKARRDRRNRPEVAIRKTDPPSRAAEAQGDLRPQPE
jgi:DNA-directed RNA polymerase subunit M/transcription elongation factor TFIIS